jgi:hypothetical protein
MRWRSVMLRSALLTVGGGRLWRASALVPLLAVLMLGGWLPAGAADEESVTDLVKKTQNPVADLTSVPFENNFNFRVQFLLPRFK